MYRGLVSQSFKPGPLRIVGKQVGVGYINAFQRNGVRIPVRFFLCVAWQQVFHSIIPCALIILESLGHRVY